MQCCILFGSESIVSADDLLQDIAGALGPGEWLGVDVVMSDVAIKCGDEFGHAGEDTATQAVLGDVAEEALKHVQP